MMDRMRVPTRSPGPEGIAEPSNWMWVTALCVFASGAFCGFFLTGLVLLAPGSWCYWVGARILWQLGGGIWCGASLCTPLGVPKWKGALAGGLIGGMLCLNPLLDVVRGPQVVAGTVTEAWEQGGRLWRSQGSYSNTIHGTVEIQQADGGAYVLHLSGRQVNAWLARLAQYRDNVRPVRVVVLEHLCIVLKVEDLPMEEVSVP